MSKLEEKELEQLKDYQSKKNAVFHDLGMLEAQKHGLLHALAEVNDQANTFYRELEEKYGKINVNLEDGSFQELEDGES